MSKDDDGLPPLRDVLRTYGINARKNLGQNFLLDLNLTRKIARSAGPLKNLTVIEIGPGPGGLTRALLSEGARHVIAIEHDSRCTKALQQISAFYPSRLTIIEGDALRQDYDHLAKDHARIVANLPYNIGTSLLTGWLSGDTWPPFFDRLVLMLQLEVAQRIVASTGTKQYGRLSILAQWRCTAEILFTVPNTAFTPQPKVTSALIALTPRASPYPCDRVKLAQLTMAAFGQRRKMLGTSLKQIDPDISGKLQFLGIDPRARAETLSVERFCALALMLDGHVPRTIPPI